MDAKQVHTKYIFLDVVGYSHNRSVEAQSDIIDILNNIVLKCIELIKLSREKLILLPVGDGIIIAITEHDLPYDIHLDVSKSILNMLNDHNKQTEDIMRKFTVRIGLNENVDNIITDINDKINVTGMGINMAQRIMGAADGNQILVGESVYSTLGCREKYMKSFRQYQTKIKHDQTINVYQFTQEGIAGLNIDTPSLFSTKENKLPRYHAYYLYHGIINKEFLVKISRSGQGGYSGTTVLNFLAEDSLEKENAGEFKNPTYKLHGKGKLPIEAVFNYYEKNDFWVIHAIFYMVWKKFASFLNGFESPFNGLIFINDAGKSMLEKYHPDIWKTIPDELKK